MQAQRVLVVEDEKQIRKILRSALEEEGFVVGEAETLSQGLIEAGASKPDLIILDLGLPDGDGITLIEEVRTWSDVPILVLSARFQDLEKIRALDAGADDYITKPFSVGEIFARVRALLRRKNRIGEEATPVMKFGSCEVDFSTRSVLRDGVEVHLTPIEYRLLCTLLSHPGKVLTQRTILEKVWGPTFSESSHYLRIYISHLRQKLEIDPTRPLHLITEIGVGYRFKQ
jgi:two-component system, OmpR family, KDP operon response regulator KdpE